MTTASDRVPQPVPARSHHFRMRGLDVRLESDSDEIDAALENLVNRADEWEPVERQVRFDLTRRADGRVRVTENSAMVHPARTLPEALAVVHGRLGTHLAGTYERYTFLHAGAVTIDGRLIIVAGHRGAGKTTLLVRLALDGALFHCDEHVMAGVDGLARTTPRRLHVKPGTFVCIPEIEKRCRQYPLLVLDGGVLFYPLDLADLGIPWRSATRRPAAIVHLTPPFIDVPVVTRIAQIESVKRLIYQARSGDLEFGRQAADICGVVRGAPSFEVRVGPVTATADAIRGIAASISCA